MTDQPKGTRGLQTAVILTSFTCAQADGSQFRAAPPGG